MGIFQKRKTGEKNYGIFIMTKLVHSGRPVKFAWRQEADEEAGTNGWSIFSGEENEQDMGDLVFVGIKDIERLVPRILEIFDAPVGTEVGFVYDEEGNHTEYYDMAQNRIVTIEEILSPK